MMLHTIMALIRLFPSRSAEALMSFDVDWDFIRRRNKFINKIIKHTMLNKDFIQLKVIEFGLK